MGDMTEKVYCFDRPSGNNEALTTAALMNNNGNNWMNNPFAYMMFAWVFDNMNRRNGYGAEGAAYNSQQIAALQDSVNTNHNNDLVMQALSNNQAAIRELAQTFNTDLSTIQQGLCNINASLQTVGGTIGLTGEQVKNAVLLGNQSIIQQLQSCCCDNKMLQMQNFSAQQLQASQNQASTQAGLENVRQAVVNGFSSTAYETQRQTCDILNNQNANTQKIIDTLNQHWQQETALALQDEKFKNSQLQQNQYLASLITGQNCGGCGCK